MFGLQIRAMAIDRLRKGTDNEPKYITERRRDVEDQESDDGT
jgi:hypothetical protein